MQIRLRGLGSGFVLADWDQRPFAPGTEDGPRERDHCDQYEREVAHEPPGPPLPDGVFRHVAAAILRYEIFPLKLVTGVVRRAPVAVDDTVGIVYHAPLGIDLMFAARIIDTFDEDGKHGWRCGFTYRTLVGHPELGEETFAVSKDRTTGAVRVSLESWSRPGVLLARLFAPIVRRRQVGASAAAPEHLHSVADAHRRQSGENMATAG